MTEAAPAEAPAATPVMAQYWAIKEAHPDCLLFFRMGDFYELFFDDAVAAAAALDIALTHRGRHQGEAIPMCGVPVHSHDTYLARLIRKGFKVAVCEQLEAPAEARKRGAKAVVARDVVRIVTAGTLTEDALLDARRPNHLAAVAEAAGGLGLAWADISTGLIRAAAVADVAGLAAALAGIEPGEILVPDGFVARPAPRAALAEWQTRLTLLPSARFDSLAGERRLMAVYRVGSLGGFGEFSRAEIAALGALVDYVQLTQKGQIPQLAPPVHLVDADVMHIDAATRRNLELTTTLGGGRKGSLLDLIDRTVTGMGARRLAARLAAPSTDPVLLGHRLDAVAALVDDGDLCRRLRGVLAGCPDLERAVSRLALGRGGPRDLAAVRDALTAAGALHRLLAGAAPAPLPQHLAAASAALADPAGDGGGLHGALTAALAEELPVSIRDGQFIAHGYDPGLDETRRLRDDSRRLILDLEARYVEETGLPQLKIRHNNLLGYYVEVPQRLAERMPAAAAGPFIQRQSMANAVRYATVDLADLERRIAHAADDALARETAIFTALAAMVQAVAPALARTARAIAGVDVAAGLALVASENRYVRPAIEADPVLEIVCGRHPVVEAMLKAAAGPAFVGNDCSLGDPRRLWLLTGPNMAGKSTFLRQNALIAILAQIGSFVPADRARIGIVDRLFSRVGAADDLARGRSTFMVEMVETAIILREAGPRSLVILDEVGRGTATFDGLSIAWAVVEHLGEVNGCRGLVATHYHELTALVARLPVLACHTMRTKEWRGDVVFLHEVAPGAADRSYGVHVARLAGLPDAAVARAEEILGMLERSEPGSAVTRLAADLPLFAAALARDTAPTPPAPSAVETRLKEINPDELSPKQALELIYQLKGLSRS
ncbi:MAG: DNA mismatch repair protein MutS [Rhodospirillales bacterium]